MRSRGRGFLKQIGTLYAYYATPHIQNGFLRSTMAKTPFSFIRPYSTGTLLLFSLILRPLGFSFSPLILVIFGTSLGN